MLSARRKWIASNVLNDFGNIKRLRARLQVERDQPNQRDQRADAKIERDLERGVVLLFAAAPDANHNKRRHQRQFVKEIEEKQVQRGERAKDAPCQQQQQDVKLLLAIIDFP